MTPRNHRHGRVSTVETRPYKEARPPTPHPEEASFAHGEIAVDPAKRPAPHEFPPWNPQTAPHKVEPPRRPGPHATSRRGRRRGGFQTRPYACTLWRTAQGVGGAPRSHQPPTTHGKEARPPTSRRGSGGRRVSNQHQQNRARPPLDQPPTTSQSPPRPEEADVGAGFKPARARTSRTAQGEVAPPRSHQPPPTSQSPPWNPQGGPAPHAASRRGRRRGGFQTRPRPHQQNSPRRSRRPSVPPTAPYKPNPTVEPARRPGPPDAASTVRQT